KHSGAGNGCSGLRPPRPVHIGLFRFSYRTSPRLRQGVSHVGGQKAVMSRSARVLMRGEVLVPPAG
ncbi:MAG: hypothetical protein WCY72_10615, partial [Lysobacteraceae bacterium]